MATTPLTPELRQVLSTLDYEEVTEFLVDQKGRTQSFPSLEAARTAAKGNHVTEVAFTKVTITEGQLDPKVYGHFKRVLELLGGTWESHQKYHRFNNNPQGTIREILHQGFIPDLNPFDFFPTPIKLVRNILSASWIEDEIESIKRRREEKLPVRVLEPSAGSGAIASEIAQRIGDPQAVLCLELNPLNAATLRSQGLTVEEIDFLQFKTDEKFDLIVMNPPFDGKTWRKHLLHAMTFLSKYGKLACIAPASAKSTSNPKDKQFVRELLTFGSIEDNEPGAFRQSGTNVETVTIYYTKDERPRTPIDGYPHFDALTFDLGVNNNSKTHGKKCAILADLIKKIGDDKIAETCFEDLPQETQDEVIAQYENLNDEILNEGFAANLTREDFCLIIEADLVEFVYEETGIRKKKQASKVPAKPAEQIELFPTEKSA